MLRFCVLALLAAVVGPAAAGAAGPADSPWPMFQHDARHTGRSPDAAPTRLALAWQAPLHGIPGGPAIGEDGTIYVGTGDPGVDEDAGSLYAINPDGSQKWRFVFPTGPPATDDGCHQLAGNTTPAVADDGTVYVHTQSGDTPNGAFCTAGPSHVWAIEPDGDEKWHHQMNLGAAVFTGGTLSSPAIGADGTIYVGSKDTALYALDPDDGSELWVSSPVVTSISSSPAIGADGTVYVSIFDLYAYEPDGDPKWAAEVGDGAPNHSSPAIGADGTVYGCFLNPNACHAVEDEGDDGTSEWSVPHTAGISSPAIAADGTVLLAAGASEQDGRLVAVDADGDELWSFPSPLDAMDTPIVDADGRVYLRVDIDFSAVSPGTFVDVLLVLGPDGAELDRREVPEAGDIGDIAMAIGSDGTLYAPLPHQDFGYDPDDNHLGAFVDGRRLTVTRTGGASGAVTGPGIDCRQSGLADGDCIETYLPGTSVTLHAEPANAGAVFAGWGGACSGTGDCTITMDSDTSVSAAFEPAPSVGPPPAPPFAFPPATNGTGPSTPGTPPDGGSAFGARTRVSLALAVRRVAGGAPLAIRVVNGNPFPVTGVLRGETAGPVVAQRARRIRLRSRSFRVPANARRTVRIALPVVLRRRLRRTGRLGLRLRATVTDPAGTTRAVVRRVTVRRRR